jgi:predicted nucleotidyltransferase component of viral defense system
MSSKAMSLKSRINQYAKRNDLAAQVVLQNYMFERFLERLSASDYQNKFVIKGGMLIAAIVGLDSRATMDLDTTLRDLPLTEDKIQEAITTICGIKLNDEVSFKLVSITPIRKDDPYGGFSVRLDALFDTIVTPLSIDISTGDVMTPDAINYELMGIFDDKVRFKLWGYNIETIMAEKVETILSRGTFSTRPRDYYDIYILATTQKFDKGLFGRALRATAEHRGSVGLIFPYEEIMVRISESSDLRQQWEKYQKKFNYAKNISYEEIIEKLKYILAC